MTLSRYHFHTLAALRPVGRLLKAAVIALISSWAATSCDVHEFYQADPPGAPCTLHLSFDTDEFPLYTQVDVTPDGTLAPASRSGEAENDFRYTVNIYRTDATEASPEMTIRTTRFPGTSREFDIDIPLELPKGSYRILIWADFVESGSQDDLHYNTGSFLALNINPDSRGRHPGNTPEREAWRGQCSVEITEESLCLLNTDIYAIMERPLARFRFIATDVEEFMAGEAQKAEQDSRKASYGLGSLRAVVRYTGYMPSAYNLFTDKPVDSSTGQWFEGKIKPESTAEAEMGYDYVFVPQDDSSVQLALDIYDADSNSRLSSTPTITVPLRRGHLTEIYGRFLTTRVQGGAGIDPGFNGDFNIEIK